MSRIIKRIIWGVFAILIIAQFFQIDKTNPEFDASKDFLKVVDAPEDIAFMLKTTCYDCHSYETKYPWYTSISPINWWVKDHIDEGRDKLNFSIWADYPERRANHKLEECYEEVEKMLMPLRSYTRVHSEARLTPEQRATIVEWFKEQEQKTK
jgi:hypothetical protein